MINFFSKFQESKSSGKTSIASPDIAKKNRDSKKKTGSQGKLKIPLKKSTILI